MPSRVCWRALIKPVSQRLFFALWPAPVTAQAIWQAASDLVPSGTGRRLPPEHIHLTLAFLGSIDDAQQDCMTRTAAGVQGQVFTLELDEAGHFPRPQVVWLGARQLPQALRALQSKLVSELMRHCGFEPETRPFVPHITLWRKVRHVRLPEAMEPVSWPVTRFVLARSRSLPGGVEYSIVQEWPLSAGAD